LALLLQIIRKRRNTDLKKPKMGITTAWGVKTKEDSIKIICYSYVGKFTEVCKGGSCNGW